MRLIEKGPKKIKIKEKKGLLGPTEIREEQYVIAKEASGISETPNYTLADAISEATDVRPSHSMVAITHTRGVY